VSEARAATLEGEPPCKIHLYMCTVRTLCATSSTQGSSGYRTAIGIARRRDVAVMATMPWRRLRHHLDRHAAGARPRLSPEDPVARMT